MKIRENFYSWDDFAYNLTACNYSYIQLIDFNARFYSPRLGRFIQPDSVIPDLTNSQAWNRYSYVLNSPIKYVDPSGHVAVENGEKCLPGSNCDPGMKPWGTIEDKELTDEDLKKMKSSGGLDEWGEKMIDVYTWYRDADGWWNEDGDFTITDFLAVALQIEYGKGPSRVSLWTAVGVSAKYKIMHIGSAYDPRGNFDIYSSMFVYIGERQSMRIVWTNEKINDKSASFMGGFEKWKEFAIAAFPTVNDFNSWDLNPNVPFEFKNYSMYTSAGQVKIANADLGVDQKEKYQSSPYWIDNEPFDGAVLVLTFQQNEYWDQYLAP